MTQKNKIFSIILSLLVLSSLSCRKSGGGDGVGVVTEPDALPGTFSITEASGNVKALVVKPDTTVSDIKIAFSSSTDYTAEFTVEDSETVEANKITSEDFEFANNSLTAKTTLVDKVRKLDSSSQAVDKTIKINFTFKAKDTTLKNNTKTISIEVKLTKELAFKLSSLVGTWEITGDTQNKFTIDENGKTTGKVANQNFDFTITDWNKDKEVSQLTETFTSTGVTSVEFTFIFKNVESCTVTVKANTTETKILNKVKTK
ncbi:hypothetical protein EPJ67_06705 [Brachyspira aalborgi]|uniref:Lipocalin-like domain-containing protein n=1 Tax=Brachyspira aalborgi TaxID=29522 RepID=A0A5C8G4J5_9SPIR|nr:hypothetical protein [Brachyspira aalborgi]TXJ56587.1 hypothetical protein EPJ67_06705 [Brachyspira aalborgi]